MAKNPRFGPRLALSIVIGATQGNPSAGASLIVGKPGSSEALLRKVEDGKTWPKHPAADTDVILVKPEFYDRNGNLVSEPTTESEAVPIELAAKPAPNNSLEFNEKQKPIFTVFFGLHKNRGQPLSIQGNVIQAETNGIEKYGGSGSWVLLRLGDAALESHFITILYDRGSETADMPPSNLRKAGSRMSAKSKQPVTLSLPIKTKLWPGTWPPSTSLRTD